MFKYPDLRAKSRTKTRHAFRHVAHCPHEDAIVDHVAKHLARPAFVIHEIESELVHVDVHVVPPAPAHDFWFLFTTGMSARPMSTPRDVPATRLAEVSILLPPHWPMDRDAWRRDARWSWPIRELKEAAFLPHRHHTWLGFGHTIIPADITSSGITTSVDPSTRLSALIVSASDLLPEEIDTIAVGDDRIDLLTLIPIYPEELDYSVKHGAEALIDQLNTVGVSDVIDPIRRSAVAISAAR
jgi:hypothetical protein